MTAASEQAKPAVLVAPLDWGLGHATRCIPIIQALMRRNCHVLIAGEEPVKSLLLKEFPYATFLDLEGYRVRYGRSGLGTALKLSAGIPHMLSAISHEQRWLQKAVRQYGIRAIISDNRYGLYHSSIPSVFVTHQLGIRTPFGSVADHLLRHLNYRYIDRFSACWVPDFQKAPGLAGALSHPARMPRVPVHYVGPLSRFRAAQGANVHQQKLLILLSGPEPQRTLFEEQCLKQLRHYKGEAVLVRGLPACKQRLDAGANVRVFNHLGTHEMYEELASSALVIARSGYSTVMDLAAMQKRAVIVPTPGQSEQLYLAWHLHTQGMAVRCPQAALQLPALINIAENFPYCSFPLAKEDGLEKGIQDLLERV